MNLPIVPLAVIVVLTVIEGFFVAAEIALVSIRRSRVEQLAEEGDHGARRVRRLLNEPGRFLAVCQLGLTFIGFFASAYAAVSLADQLTTLLEGAGMDAGTAAGLSLVTVTILLALFTIVFAELVPKTLALAHAERFAITLSLPIEFLARVLGPIIRFLTWITNAVVRLFGAEVTSDAQITAEELRLIVERGGEQGILEAEEEQMINAVIELGDQRVHEVMVPRIHMVSLAGRLDARRRHRHGDRRGPQPHPGLRRLDRRDRRDPLRQGPPAVPQGHGGGAAGPALDPADPGVRPGVDVGGRPPPRAPAPEGPPRDRPRRVRRHGRPGHDRGPPRGDRRRDPGRVRRGGAAHRQALRRRGPDRRPSRDRRPRGALRHLARARRRGPVRHGRRAHLPPHRRRAQARRPGRRRRVDADGRDDRRPAGRARSWRSASGPTPRTRRTDRPSDDRRLAAADPPPGDPLRFSTIAHGERTILGPIAPERLDALVDGLDLAPGARVVELGVRQGRPAGPAASAVAVGERRGVRPQPVVPRGRPRRGRGGRRRVATLADRYRRARRLAGRSLGRPRDRDGGDRDRRGRGRDPRVPRARSSARTARWSSRTGSGWPIRRPTAWRRSA